MDDMAGCGGGVDDGMAGTVLECMDAGRALMSFLFRCCSCGCGGRSCTCSCTGMLSLWSLLISSVDWHSPDIPSLPLEFAGIAGASLTLAVGSTLALELPFRVTGTPTASASRELSVRSPRTGDITSAVEGDLRVGVGRPSKLLARRSTSGSPSPSPHSLAVFLFSSPDTSLLPSDVPEVAVINDAMDPTERRIIASTKLSLEPAPL